ncbi:MAG: hypothetical protein KC609_03535 [Myxococcales bacterium]|nr:hypothetical protein [Myxococcales bacterium]
MSDDTPTRDESNESERRRQLEFARRVLPFAGSVFELMFQLHGFRSSLKRALFSVVGAATRDQAATLQDQIDRLHGSVRALERLRRAAHEGATDARGRQPRSHA